MSFVSSTVFRFPPYPEKKLTMDEMLAKLINKGKREHEKMEIFIKEFRTTNELLLKEQNNLLSELKSEVNELSRVMNEVWFSKHKVKGVTTRGGKVTSKVTYDNEMHKGNNDHNEPSRLQHDKPKKPQEVVVENESPKAQERIIQPSIEPERTSIPFPNRLRKEKEEAQQRKFLENLKQLHINIPFIEALVQMPKYAKYLKNLLMNKSRLEEACTITMNERCSAILLNKLPSKEKDPGSFL
ncbi:hypothetical protein Tco_1525609 [Tanacetum coccineum]